MHTPRRPNAVAFLLSVFITVAIFSGVTSLAGQDTAGALLANVAVQTSTLA